MKLTIYKAAIELGVSRDTLSRNLTAQGYKVGKGKTFTLRQIFAALTGGDLKQARTREALARAEKLELENQVSRNELVNLGEVQKMIFESVQHIRDCLNALPAEAANRANPADPQHARAALEEWLKMVLPKIRAGLPQPTPENSAAPASVLKAPQTISTPEGDRGGI